MTPLGSKVKLCFSPGEHEFLPGSAQFILEGKQIVLTQESRESVSDPWLTMVEE
jgi:hypothetical protein